MGVIVAGIITPCGAVVKCQDANMGSEAGEGKVEPLLLWSSGLLLFDAPGPGWVRCNRACEVLVPKSARDACTVVVACRNRPAGRAPALRPDRRIFPTRFVGPAARVSAHGAYSAFEPASRPRSRSPTECVVQQSTCAWRRIFVRDIPSRLLRGRRFHSEDGYLIGSR